MNEIHRDSLAAWIDFQQRGGIELQGRDEGLDDELKNRLMPSAQSLEEALQTTTTDDFVSIFFSVLEPFVAMFRAILDFFEKAAATEGREQWNIMVDDVDFKLIDFLRFLKKWDSVPCEIEVPAVDFQGAWLVSQAIDDIPEMKIIYQSAGPYWSGISDIDKWLRAYRAGVYEELPQSLAPSRLGPGYADAAALALVALKVIRQGYASREALIAEHRARSFHMDRADALSPRTIAQNETDFWLQSLVSVLACSQTLPSALQEKLGNRLKDKFAPYPRKKFNVQITVADLQAYLSLPVWKKRHELYAVWIATEIVNAVPDHRCEIHSEDGRIVFAFRETIVATIKSSWPPVKLISERRVPLAAPVGKGRSANVQPDYGLWRSEGGVETCGLVVEVKHYKRSASSSFGDVLIDYARAFPTAEVYLVNHGPVGHATKDMPRELLRRCNTIKELTASNSSAREELRKAVRKYVGDPVIKLAKTPGSPRADTVLAVDVSASMRSYLSSPTFSKIVQEIVDERCEMAALIDIDVRTLVQLEELPTAIEAAIDGGSTDLDKPIRKLLTTFDRAIVVTDDEGANTLKPLSKQTTVLRQSGLVVLEVLSQ